MNEDGLLGPVDEEDAAWLRPNFGEIAADDVIKASVRWISDVLQSRQVIWPAAFEGRLTVPPAAHVLDALTREYLPFGNDPTWDAEWSVRPVAGTVALVSELPDCDICNRRNGARYDAPSSRYLPAPKANLCPWCYQRRSTTQLGMGQGQFLLRYAEVPGHIWDAASGARELWSHRGAPVTDETLDEHHRVEPPRRMDWPYGPPFAGQKTRRQGMLEDLLLAATVEQDAARGLFSDIISWDDRGSISYYTTPHPIDGISQLIRFGEDGTRHLDALAADVCKVNDVRKRADLSEVRHLVVRQVSRILVEGSSPTKVLSKFESSVRKLVGPVVWVAPLGGVTWDGPPRLFDDAFLIGRIGPDMHHAINDMAAANGISAQIDFDCASAWAEDYEASLNDPDAFEDWETEAWRPVVAAQVVDAVGSVAHHLGFQKLYSFAGAIWAAAAQQDNFRRTTPPWVLGEPGHAEGLNVEQDGSETGTVTVYTLRGTASTHDSLYYVDAASIDLLAILAHEAGSLVDVVARWLPSDVDDNSPKTRVAASARHAKAGLESRDLYFSAFHLVAAMETLLIVSEDSIGSTLARRVAALLDRKSARSEVKQLYDLRSKAAHRGLSARPLADAVQLVNAGWARLPLLMGWVAKRSQPGMSMGDVVVEIDALPEPTDE